MKKQHQNSEQPAGVPESEAPKRENELIIEGVTKICPHCGENLPEKIGFCLYCMKPLSEDAIQKSASMPQGNGGNRSQKTSTKILIGATALLAVVVIVVATSFITASILSRQGNAPHYQSAIVTPTMSPNESADSAFGLESSPTPQYTQQSAQDIATPNTATSSSPAQTDSPTDPTPSPQPTASPSAGGRGNRPSSPTISLERAIEIAYADIATRGVNASFRSDSGMSWERGQWVWELLFSTQGERMPLIEFYINVDDGSIVKFEWDD